MFVQLWINTFFMKRSFVLDSAYDGVRLSAALVAPDDAPKAVMLIAHGMCGCKDKYLAFMEYMSEHGVACVAYDHRGHGMSVRSAEELGYMGRGGYLALVDDMKKVSDWAEEMFPGVPLVLLGQSMGSMAARVYAKTYDSHLSGLILCGSPGYEPVSRVLRVLTWFMCLFNDGRGRPRFIQNMASSRYNKAFASEGPMAWVCSDPAVCKGMLQDQRMNFVFTYNGFHSLLGLMMQTYSKKGWMISNSWMPVVFLSGEDDPCMRGEEGLHHAASLMCSLGYHDVSSVMFRGMRHEILSEKEKMIVWDDILNFIMGIRPK